MLHSIARTRQERCNRPRLTLPAFLDLNTSQASRESSSILAPSCFCCSHWSCALPLSKENCSTATSLLVCTLSVHDQFWTQPVDRLQCMQLHLQQTVFLSDEPRLVLAKCCCSRQQQSTVLYHCKTSSRLRP